MLLICRKCSIRDCSKRKPVRLASVRYGVICTVNALVCNIVHINKMCPFFSFFFYPKDELIRQVTINCTERGLLLLRIRDEIAMSMEAYETLYCSSVAFGLRKALQAQEGKEALAEKVSVLEVRVRANIEHFLSIYFLLILGRESDNGINVK